MPRLLIAIALVVACSDAPSSRGAPGGPPEEVVAWVVANGAPLTSAEAGHGFDDLAPIGAMVGDARVVALGEATHGTREFFQMKHRLFAYLVAAKGFTVLAFEANQPECRAINEYVLHGTGDATTALAGIYFWTPYTEEVLAVIEWIRAWNRDPGNHPKVQVVGFDMQTTTVAHANVVAFVRKVAAADADALLAPLSPLGKRVGAPPLADVADGLATLAERFERERSAWTQATDGTTYASARQDLRLLAQAVTMHAQGDVTAARFEARDRAMAENVEWLRTQHPEGTRMVIWAHNAHVGFGVDGARSMGRHLRERLGEDYVSFGFLFGHGAFRAVDYTDKQRGPIEHTVGPPPESDVSALLGRTGQRLLALDLRTLPERGAVRDWFDAAHPLRETGAVFLNAAMTSPVVLPARYDAVIYIDRTTSSRPLAPVAPGR